MTTPVPGPVTTNVENLATRLGTEFKTAYTRLGDLQALDTTARASLVVAVNEVKATADAAAGGGVSIDDGQVRSDATWSSTKTRSEIDTAVSNVTVDLTDLIDDTTTSTSSVFSSTRTQSEIDSRIETRLDVSTAELDTFREVAAALADQDSALAAINTSLANRVRHDAAQTIADGGTQARANIGAASAADVGDVTGFNPVAVFEDALQ